MSYFVTGDPLNGNANNNTNACFSFMYLFLALRTSFLCSILYSLLSRKVHLKHLGLFFFSSTLHLRYLMGIFPFFISLYWHLYMTLLLPRSMFYYMRFCTVNFPSLVWWTFLISTPISLWSTTVLPVFNKLACGLSCTLIRRASYLGLFRL